LYLLVIDVNAKIGKAAVYFIHLHTNTCNYVSGGNRYGKCSYPVIPVSRSGTLGTGVVAGGGTADVAPACCPVYGCLNNSLGKPC
jgi:hypothetical protein